VVVVLAFCCKAGKVADCSYQHLADPSISTIWETYFRQFHRCLFMILLICLQTISRPVQVQTRKI